MSKIEISISECTDQLIKCHIELSALHQRIEEALRLYIDQSELPGEMYTELLEAYCPLSDLLERYIKDNVVDNIACLPRSTEPPLRIAI